MTKLYQIQFYKSAAITEDQVAFVANNISSFEKMSKTGKTPHYCSAHHDFEANDAFENMHHCEAGNNIPILESVLNILTKIISIF